MMIRSCYIAQSILPENVKLFILSATWPQSWHPNRIIRSKKIWNFESDDIRLLYTLTLPDMGGGTLEPPLWFFVYYSRSINFWEESFSDFS